MVPRRTPDTLRPADLESTPVWEFTNQEALGDDELTLRPVRRLPVTDLENRLVGVQLRLADGSVHWGLLSNISLDAPDVTPHFLTVSVWCGDRWFPLARYQDVARDEFGPAQLAETLGKALSAVFPIAYDIRTIAQGHERALCGVIDAEPSARLSRAELIALAVARG